MGAARRRKEESLLGGGHDVASRAHSINAHRNRGDAEPYQRLSERGSSGGACPHSDGVSPRLRAAVRIRSMASTTAASDSSKSSTQSADSRSDTECQLREALDWAGASQQLERCRDPRRTSALERARGEVRTSLPGRPPRWRTTRMAPSINAPQKASITRPSSHIPTPDIQPPPRHTILGPIMPPIVEDGAQATISGVTSAMSD